MSPPVITRDARQRLIEELIVAFRPDASEAIEILAALYKTIKDRYEDAAVDALEHANLFREALDELDRTMAGRNGPDEMDIARIRRACGLS